jgi:uncharacterized protein (UPF0332 family)
MRSITLLLPNDNFNPVELYVFAGDLYLNYQHEAAYRSVINRVYYAAFLSARKTARITNASGSIHNEVITYFEARDKKLYKNLKDLKALRSKADYLLTETVQKREAGESLRLGKNILTTLNYLP